MMKLNKDENKLNLHHFSDYDILWNFCFQRPGSATLIHVLEIPEAVVTKIKIAVFINAMWNVL